MGGSVGGFKVGVLMAIRWEWSKLWLGEVRTSEPLINWIKIFKIKINDVVRGLLI